MTTPTGQIIASAHHIFEILDSLGRNLKVRRINALDRLRLLKAAGPELSKNDAWLDMAALALSVVEIDGTPRPTPTNERQIETAILELGDHGLQAAAETLNQNDDAMFLFDSSPGGNVVGTPS